MSRVIGIVQARVGSTRLPRKVLKDIVGKPLLWHVINRLKKAKLIDEIVVATTTKEEDEPIIKLAKDNDVKSYAGSEEDVLDRYYQAAKIHKADVIVRVTADCPLLDPDVVDKVIKYFLGNDFDYVSNADNVGGRKVRKPTYPDGLDTEVFSFDALERAWKEAKMSFEREHVTPYIWKHPEIFKVGSVKCNEDLSHMRWTVDYEEDLMFVREVYKRLYRKGEIFHMKDILTLLRAHSELMDINRKIVRNEGYFKSLEKDKASET
jgi:spore coat polysaccharide biosynthesis protein SpsF